MDTEMSKEQIRKWLSDRGVNNYGGAISVEDVVDVVYDFQNKVISER